MNLGEFLVSEVDAAEARPGQIYFAVLEHSTYLDRTETYKIRLKMLPPREVSGPAGSRPVKLHGLLGAIGANPVVVKTGMGVVRVVETPSGKCLTIISERGEQLAAVAVALALEEALDQGREEAAGVQ